jgi:DNA polymerase bacteriophage-type
VLFLDLETYSDLDLKKVSLDRYAAHPSTRILMCAYALNDGPVELWQEGDDPTELFALLRSEVCVAWNVGFERTLISHVWKTLVRFKITWRDAMVDSLYAGLPAGLKDCNRVPFFAGESQTSKETGLINKFCKPAKDLSVVHNRDTDPEDWKAFCDYCKDDVFDTRLILQWIMARFDLPDRVMRAWHIDQTINQRGTPVDRLMTFRAWEEAQRLQAEGAEELRALTGLENPNSPIQLLGWLKERGYPYGGLAKELVLKALKEDGENIADD